ncbi:MAG: 50S ribosomal protein L19 [Pseudobdellovibrionaceae bacterium]
MAKTTKKAAKTKPAVETNLIRRVSIRPANKNIATFNTGDTVSVFVKVKEGEKERTQVYKGVVTKIQGAGAAKAFTVRKVSAGVGVERSFPFASPSVEKVEVFSTGKVRRSRLFYLRNLDGKAAKIESKLAAVVKKDAAVEAEVASEEAN